MNIPPDFYSRLLRNANLSLGAFKLWHYLRDRCGNKDRCWPSQRTIATDIGVNIKSLPRWTAELIAERLLEKESAGQRHHWVYILVIPKTVVRESEHPKTGQSRITKNDTTPPKTVTRIVPKNGHLIDNSLIDSKELKSELSNNFYELTEEQRSNRLTEIRSQSGFPKRNAPLSSAHAQPKTDTP